MLHRKQYTKLVIGLAIVVTIAGCGQVTKSTTEPKVSNLFDSTTTVMQRPAVTPNVSYPNYCFGLNVPFVCQYSGLADKDVTKNCGEACAVMLGGYFNHGTVNYQEIINEDSWLATRFNDKRYNSLGGYYTNFTGRNELGTLLREYHNLRYEVNYGSSPQAVVGELMYGRPVIVGVMISYGQIVSSGGVPHWVIATGWSNGIVVNDPGSIYGKGRWLSLQQFDATWATQGRIYVPVYR